MVIINRAIPLLSPRVPSCGIALLIINMSIQKMLLRGWYPRGQQWHRPNDNSHVSTENVTTSKVPSGTNSSGIALLIINMSWLLSIGRYNCCPRGYHRRSNIFCTDMFINNRAIPQNVTTRMVPLGTVVISPY
jgi:hypothetical protein